MACELQGEGLFIQSKAIPPGRGRCDLLIANRDASYGRKRRLYVVLHLGAKLTTVTSAISIRKGWYQVSEYEHTITFCLLSQSISVKNPMPELS